MKRGSPPATEKEDITYSTIRLYDGSKHDGEKTQGVRTGYAMKVNTTDWAIVDIDVKIKQNAQKKIDEYLAVLDKEKDVVVCTVNGGLHLYLYDDTEFKGRNIKVFKCDDFDVDVFLSKPREKRSLLVLPGSKCLSKDSRMKEYTYHPDFKTQLPKDFKFRPHTKASVFFLKFPELAPIDSLDKNSPVKKSPAKKQKARLPVLQTPFQTPLTPQKESSDRKTVQRRRSTIAPESELFKSNIERLDIRDKALKIFELIADIEIHADWNQNFVQEITLYHFFGVLNWLEIRSITPLEEAITPLLRFTEKANAQYSSRKERYQRNFLSPQVLAKCLHAIKRNDERDVSFKNALDSLFDLFKTTDTFTCYSIDLSEKFDYGDFIDLLPHTKSCNEALTLLSRVYRYIRFAGVYVLKKWNDEQKKYIYSVESEKQTTGEAKRLKFTTAWGNFRLTTLLEYANVFLYCRKYSLFQQKEGYLCCFEGWPFEPKAIRNDLVEAFFRFTYVGLCKSDPEKFSFLVKWCANIVKNPGAKNCTIIVLSGPQGCGKTTFVNILSRLFGHYAVENIDDVKHLTQKFNKAMVARKVLVCVNEMSVVCEKDLGVLKTLCTEKTGVTEDKYERKELTENYVNIFITTNDIANFEFSEDERRFYIIEAENYLASHGENEHTQFFSRLYKGLNDDFFSALMNVFMNVDLTDFEPSIAPHVQKRTRVSLASPHVKEFYDTALAQASNDKEYFYSDELYKLYCSFFDEDEKPPEKNAFYKSDVASLFEKKRERFRGQRHYTYRLKKKKVSLRSELPPEESTKIPPEEDAFFKSLFLKQTCEKKASLDDRVSAQVQEQK